MFEHFKMSFKLLLISSLLVVNAQKFLFGIPDACSVPKSPPTCMYSTATPYFKSCGIYNGGSCPRFCHALQAQYWTRQRFRRRCFRFSPSLMLLKRIFSLCMLRCVIAKKRIRQYRLDGLKKIGSNAARFGWKSSNIKALIYLSVNRYGFVTNRSLVYTSNYEVHCLKNNNGTSVCMQALPGLYNGCTCSACTRYRASCPTCCRLMGYFWV